MEAISSESVDTTIRVTDPEFLAWSIVYEMTGLPANGRMFFEGTPTLPPRAGIIANTLRSFDANSRRSF